jgi:hypothetical protein
MNVLMRCVAAVGLLLALLGPTAFADDDHGNHNHNQGSTANSFASGSTSIAVTPPGGSVQTALTCTNIPSAWAAPLGGSHWISTNSDCTMGVAGGNFTYTLSFTLPSGATNLDLKATVMADDSVSVALNGNGIGSGTTNATTSAAFETTSGFVTGGTNNLTFTVNNASGPSGLDFTATLTGSGTCSQGHQHGQSSVCHQNNGHHGEDEDDQGEDDQ